MNLTVVYCTAVNTLFKPAVDCTALILANSSYLIRAAKEVQGPGNFLKDTKPAWKVTLLSKYYMTRIFVGWVYAEKLISQNTLVMILELISLNLFTRETA